MAMLTVSTVLNNSFFNSHFVAGCKKIDSSIIELPVNHRVRMEGETQVYKISKIPSIALRNAIGLLKIKFMK